MHCKQLLVDQQDELKMCSSEFMLAELSVMNLSGLYYCNRRKGLLGMHSLITSSHCSVIVLSIPFEKDWSKL